MNDTSREATRASMNNRYHAANRRMKKREEEIRSNSTMIRPILKSAEFKPEQRLIKKNA